jgi:acyl-CoA reductase-like NAD-dependent aldehyde dehydrogenase
MATTLRTQGPMRPAESFDSLNPATSEVIATFAVFGEDDVARTVERAHEPPRGGRACPGPSGGPGCWPGSPT